MTRSYGWNRQRLQRTNSRNNNQSTLHGDSFVVHVFLFAATTAHDPATPRSRPGAMSAVDPGPPSPLNGPRRRSVAAPTRPRRRRYALPVLGPRSGATGHLHPPDIEPLEITIADSRPPGLELGVMVSVWSYSWVIKC